MNETHDVCFKTPRERLEFWHMHPELIRLILDLGAWCKKTKLTAPYVTCIYRTKEENRKAGGVPTSLHLRSCAVDMRVTSGDGTLTVWDEEGELPQIKTWMRGEMAKRGGLSNWECLTHDVGSGLHLHAGRRDFHFTPGANDGNANA